MTQHYEEIQPTRAGIDSLRGAVVIEFGTAWCGFCRAAQPLIEAALAAHPEVRHREIADGASAMRLLVMTTQMPGRRRLCIRTKRTPQSANAPHLVCH